MLTDDYSDFFGSTVYLENAWDPRPSGEHFPADDWMKPIEHHDIVIRSGGQDAIVDLSIRPDKVWTVIL